MTRLAKVARPRMTVARPSRISARLPPVSDWMPTLTAKKCASGRTGPAGEIHQRVTKFKAIGGFVHDQAEFRSDRIAHFVRRQPNRRDHRMAGAKRAIDDIQRQRHLLFQLLQPLGAPAAEPEPEHQPAEITTLAGRRQHSVHDQPRKTAAAKQQKARPAKARRMRAPTSDKSAQRRIFQAGLPAIDAQTCHRTGSENRFGRIARQRLAGPARHKPPNAAMPEASMRQPAIRPFCSGRGTKTGCRQRPARQNHRHEGQHIDQRCKRLVPSHGIRLVGAKDRPGTSMPRAAIISMTCGRMPVVSKSP